MDICLTTHVPNSTMGHNLAMSLTDAIEKWGKTHAKDIYYKIEMDNNIYEKV